MVINDKNDKNNNFIIIIINLNNEIGLVFLVL